MATRVQKEFTGRHMFIIMVSFFAVVVGVNMFMVYSASSSWTGLVVKNSYVASQNFNELTERLEASKALALHGRASYAGGKVVVSITAADGTPVTLENARLEMGDARSDANAAIALTMVKSGSFEAAKELAVGQWQGLVSGHVPGKGEWTQMVSIQVAP